MKVDKAEHKPSQLNARTRERHQVAFLAALSETGNVSRSAEAAGISRRLHYVWLKEDPSYPKRAAAAIATAGDSSRPRRGAARSTA